MLDIPGNEGFKPNPNAIALDQLVNLKAPEQETPTTEPLEEQPKPEIKPEQEAPTTEPLEEQQKPEVKPEQEVPTTEPIEEQPKPEVKPEQAPVQDNQKLGIESTDLLTGQVSNNITIHNDLTNLDNLNNTISAPPSLSANAHLNLIGEVDHHN